MNDKSKNESDAVKPSADKPEASKVKEPTATARAYKEQPIPEPAADNAHVATKVDLAEAKGELKDEIRKTEVRLSDKIGETEVTLRGKIGETEVTLNNKIGEVKSELTERIVKIENTMVTKDELMKTESRLKDKIVEAVTKVIEDKIINARINTEKQMEAFEKRLYKTMFSAIATAIVIIIGVLGFIISFFGK